MDISTKENKNNFPMLLAEKIHMGKYLKNLIKWWKKIDVRLKESFYGYDA